MIFFLLDSVWAADLPDLTPVSLQVPEVLTGPPNLEVTLVWGVTNHGIGPAIGNSSWSDWVYLSTNAVLASGRWHRHIRVGPTSLRT